MESRPPEVIERVVGLLIPPACREAVLGDLSERYLCRGQYVRKAVATVPFVIASQIRRRFQFQLALSEFCALYIAFYLAALWGVGTQVVLDHTMWLRFAVPAVAGALGLTLQKPYLLPGGTSPRIAITRATVGAATAFLSHVILAAIAPEWTLPVTVLISGSVASLPLIATLWTFQPEYPDLQNARLAVGSWLNSHRRALELQERVWWVTCAWFIAMSILQNVNAWSGRRGLFPNLAHIGVIIVFSIMYKMRLTDSGYGDQALTIASDTYRLRLERQRDTMRYWSAYIRPLLIALVGLPFGFVFLMWVAGWASSFSTSSSSAASTSFSVDRFFGSTFWTYTLPFALLSTSWYLVQRKLTHQAFVAIQQEIDALDAPRDSQPNP